MIYFYEGKARFMLGTERLDEVIDFKKLYDPREQQDILDFLYYTFHKKSSLAKLLPEAKKKEAIKSYKLFRNHPNKENLHLEVETWSGVAEILEIFQDYHLSEFERQRVNFLKKIEKYNAQLMDPNSTFEQEKEASTALELFNKQVERLDALIAKSEGGQKKTVFKYLFEAQENHIQALKEKGYEFK